jgi:tetratricopeptide (TPR) repeat protein
MAASASSPSPDVLYANRTDLASARRAADIWAEMLTTGPNDFDAAWKLSRACYWLGKRTAPHEQRAFLERGVAAGRQAVMLAPQRPEGHFWIASNMGALAESFGVRRGLRYRRAIRDALQTVLRLDAGFMNGAADRALGRWYFKVPSLLGGSTAKAEQHLRASLRHDSRNSVSHFFLAELLAADGRRAEARSALQAVLDAEDDAEWGPENDVYREKARALLARLQ